MEQEVSGCLEGGFQARGCILTAQYFNDTETKQSPKRKPLRDGSVHLNLKLPRPNKLKLDNEDPKPQTL